MRDRSIKRTSVFLLISILFLSSFVSIVNALAIGSDVTEVKEKIDVDDPVVTTKLQQLAPTMDEEHFTDNFFAVYEYASSIIYEEEGFLQDYWQKASETIQLGHGDCEDHAILLTALIEALYKRTFGYIPRTLVWTVAGDHIPGGEAPHAWVIVNIGLLPSETINRIKSVPTSKTIVIPILEWEIDMPSYVKKSDYGMFVGYDGDHYFELEVTWHCPISEFYYYKYPYTYSRVCLIVNSQEGYWYPIFYTVNEPRGLKADIIDVDFPQVVYVDHSYTISVTVKNYECGVIGADLYVYLYDIERHERYDASKYVRKNSETTFIFSLLHTEQCAAQGLEQFSFETEHFSLELYWHLSVGFYERYYLQDWMNIEFEIKFYLPDLEVCNMWINPTSPKSGDEVTFYANGRNNGPVDSGPWDVYLYLDGELIDTGSVSNVPADSGFDIQSDPWVATAGTHTVRYVVDATDRVSESKEYNNQKILTFTVEKKATSISIELDSTSITLGERVYISGHITLSLVDVDVTIYYKLDGGSWNILTSATSWAYNTGTYYYWWTPPSAGSYYFKASWPGNSEYHGAESPVVSLTVEEGEGASITCALSSSTIDEGSSVTMSGSVSPAGTYQVQIQYSLTGASWTAIASVTSNSDGSYSYTWAPWAGTFLIRAIAYPNDEYVESSVVSLVVEEGEESKELTSISCKVSQHIDTSPLSSITLGEQVCINGRITPEVGTAHVAIYYKLDGGSWSILEDGTPWRFHEGGYDYIYYHYWTPPTAGTYHFKASWPGDSEHLGAESGVVSLIVEEAGGEEAISFANLEELFFVDGCFTASFGYGAEANAIDTVGGTLVSAWFSSHATGGTNVDVLTDNEVTSVDEVSGPLISVGGPAVNLFWSEYNSPSIRAHFTYDSSEWTIVADGDGYDKSGGYVYEGGSETEIVTDYAIVELIWDEENNRPVLLIAGLSGHATKAACEWFYNNADDIVSKEASAFILEIILYGDGTWISTISHEI